MDRYNRHRRIIIHRITEVAISSLADPSLAQALLLSLYGSKMYVTRIFNLTCIYTYTYMVKDLTLFEIILSYCTGCFENR